MASVQYLINLLESFPEELGEKQENLSKDTVNRNYCTTLIQKTWRGFVMRRKYLNILKAVITIQSYLRGWRIRKRRKEYEETHKIDVQNVLLYKSAVIIQATWRGYIARKYMKDKCIKYRMEQRKEILKINTEMQETLKKQFLENKKINTSEDDEDYKKQVILLLFKCHHFLRTYTQEGIYSCHNSKNLSLIEQLMKALPFKKYMKEVRKVYYEEMGKISNEKKEYLFTSRKLRDIEDLLELNEKRNDNKVNVLGVDKNIHDKPFNLTSKIYRPYEKEALTSEEFTKAIECVTHNENIKSKNISQEEFNLNLKVDLKSKEIPYHIDFWQKHR